MTEKRRDANDFSTCLENAHLAQVLQNQAGEQGIGSLFVEMLKKAGHQEANPLTERIPWWRGARGEWYVCLQVALAALVFLGPRTWSGWPAVAFPFPPFATVLGIGLLAP